MRQVKIAAFLVYFLPFCKRNKKYLQFATVFDIITMYYAKGQVSFADMILI